ncbi:unnamed protein product [Urochloa decumbens]|uniref:DUF4378 domain-containing protein n=1 Tax=Urochloa decumbens TaxID=240449 RepID=A0ABC8XMK2_9POAL
MAAARGRPVTLRDFLELGCDSSSDGFRSYPRCLPWTDDALHLQPPPSAARRLPTTNNGELRRSPSRSPSSLFSLARSPSGGGPGALARISSLSRSFSRRIREGFWRRRDEEDDDLYFVDDRDSCGFPSPLVSSCSASDSDSEADLALLLDDKMAASECEKPSSSSSSSSSADHGAAADGNKMQADGDPAVGRSSSNKLGMEDKQQLSPVSVLDFPFDDDDADERSDAGTCSPSFHRCPPPPPDLLSSRTAAKQAQLLHKIRRYDGITAQAVDPVDLEARFTTTWDDSGESADASTHPATTSSSSFTDTATSSSSATTTARHGEEHYQSVEPDHEQQPDEFRLLARLLQDQEEDTAAAAAAVDEVSQLLLLDFFAEGIDRPRSSEAALVRAAAEWVRGAGLRWGISDVMLSGKVALEDMERGRRWMCVADEERDVGAAVEGLLIDGLVDELVAELVVPSWCWHGARWG